MSWNSSTMIERKRSCSTSRIDVVLAQQLAGTELEILEVERRLAILRLGVRGREAGEQLLQELAVAGGELLERERPHGLARVAEGGGARAPHASPSGSSMQALRQPRRLEQVEHVACGRAHAGRSPCASASERVRLGEQLGDGVVEALAHARLEHRARARPSAACRRR